MPPEAHPTLADLSADARAALKHVVATHAAVARAAQGVATAADELRRYAKFSRPGQPSAHIVQLRQRQATARLDSSRVTQAFLVSARGFMHAAGLTLPKGKTLESFMLEWIRLDTNDATP